MTGTGAVMGAAGVGCVITEIDSLSHEDHHWAVSEPAPGPTSAACLPEPICLDRVHFTFTAPATVSPGGAFILQFWAHLESDRDRVLELSRLTQHVQTTEDLFISSEGPFQIQRGMRITVQISVPALEIASKHKVVLWTGETGSANFVLNVPTGVPDGPVIGVAFIRANGARIAKQEFLLQIRAHKLSETPRCLSTQITAYKRAFASYATEDRSAVLARIQGMRKAMPDLTVFVDVIELRSGQAWQRELWREIAESDVLYLFWCRHAKMSTWVEQEWRYALDKRGIDFIDPIPLEDPREAPPPTELALKHFNDPLLAYITTEAQHLHEKTVCERPTLTDFPEDFFDLLF